MTLISTKHNLTSMKYKVIESSSKGNAYLVHNEILIDVGVSYSKLSPYLENIKIILLTHEHSDHFKSEVVSRIAMLHPHITFVCGSWFEDNLKRLNVSNYIIKKIDGEWLSLHGYFIYPVELYHGDRRGVIKNYGWRIIKDNHKTLHMTDTGSYEGIEAFEYNVLAIEANHQESAINADINRARENGEFVHGMLSRKYHASIEQADRFIELNANENTQVFYLHPSDTYIDKEVLNDIQMQRLRCSI